jgi:hypothetical protein
MNHCVAKIIAIVAEGRDDRRSILQLGYNLGRLSELTGLGREPFWDRWRDPVEAWDLHKLRQLAQELLLLTFTPPEPEEADPGASPPKIKGS